MQFTFKYWSGGSASSWRTQTFVRSMNVRARLSAGRTADVAGGGNGLLDADLMVRNNEDVRTVLNEDPHQERENFIYYFLSYSF